MSKCDFERCLLKAVDEGLSSLGESSKQAIYYHLERSFNVRKREIPTNVESFSRALEKIFGPGANYIETLIITRLDEKVKIKTAWRLSSNLKLADYVTKVKKNLLQEDKPELVDVEG